MLGGIRKGAPLCTNNFTSEMEDVYPPDTHYMIVDGDGNLVDLFYP